MKKHTHNLLSHSIQQPRTKHFYNSTTSTLPNNQDALGNMVRLKSSNKPSGPSTTSFVHGDVFISVRRHGQEIAGIYPYKIEEIYEHQWDRQFDPEVQMYGGGEGVEERITVAKYVLCRFKINRIMRHPMRLGSLTMFIHPPQHESHPCEQETYHFMPYQPCQHLSRYPNDLQA